jgi:MoxR-like ATPase
MELENNLFEQRTDLSKLNGAIADIKTQLSKIIVGQEQMIDLLLTGILANGHLLLEGVPGVAKTLTAKLIAKTFATQFSRIQFTPDLMPSDVTGTMIYNQKQGEFEFKKGPVFSNIVLIDEINRAPAKTQSALFEVMEERQISVDGTTHPMNYPFVILATQNPIEQEGTYRLPEAQLDRFLFKIEIDYPTLDEEFAILKMMNQLQGEKAEAKVDAVLSEEDLKSIRQSVQEIRVEERLLRYIASIVDQTRNNNSLYLGASTRASLALLNGSKAMAAIQGRDFVIPEDIKALAYPVLGHRVMATPEKEMEGINEKDIIKELVEKIEVPR